MAERACYYETLSVERDATAGEIKRAYKRLCLQHHPDKNPDDRPGAEERFKQLCEAYECLSDEQKRRAYDMYGFGPPAEAAWEEQQHPQRRRSSRHSAHAPAYGGDYQQQQQQQYAPFGAARSHRDPFAAMDSMFNMMFGGSSGGMGMGGGLFNHMFSDSPFDAFEGAHPAFGARSNSQFGGGSFMRSSSSSSSGGGLDAQRGHAVSTSTSTTWGSGGVGRSVSTFTYGDGSSVTETTTTNSDGSQHTVRQENAAGPQRISGSRFAQPSGGMGLQQQSMGYY